MKKIVTYKSGTGQSKHVHRILPKAPHIKSYASLVLLTDYYFVRDVEYQLQQGEQWDRIRFSREFLKSELKKHGVLTCHYCSKSNLIIEDENMRVPNNIKATIDHVIPISKGGAVLDVKNVVVACHKCNCKKGNMSLDEFLARRRGVISKSKRGRKKIKVSTYQIGEVVLQ